MFILPASIVAGSSWCGAGDLATVSVNVNSLGKLIPADFDGISLEVDGVRTYLGTGDSPNLVLCRLLKNIGAGTIRIGGGSTDYSCWDPQQAPHPEACGYTITDDMVKGYLNASAATGWPLIVGVNLAQNDAKWAAKYGMEVARKATSIPGSKLLGFEFGNEPDRFPLCTFGELQGKPSDHRYLRPKDFAWKDLVNDWKPFLRAFKSNAQTASIALVGPVYDDRLPWRESYLGPFIQGVGAEKLGIVTVHDYPLSADKGRKVTIAQLLAESLMKSYRSRAAGWVSTANHQNLPLELGETNSASGGGSEGTSDVFASTLWALDWLFTSAELGFRRINFHTGDAFYSAISVRGTSDGAQITYGNRVNPLYYAMYAFREAADAHILPITVTSEANIKAYAVRSCSTCDVKIFIINKDLEAAGSVTVSPSVRMGRATLLAVRAAGLDSTVLTYGGRRFDSNTGLIDRSQTTVTTPDSNGDYALHLDHASLVVLTISPP